MSLHPKRLAIRMNKTMPQQTIIFVRFTPGTANYHWTYKNKEQDFVYLIEGRFDRKAEAFFCLHYPQWREGDTQIYKKRWYSEKRFSYFEDALEEINRHCDESLKLYREWKRQEEIKAKRHPTTRRPPIESRKPEADGDGPA